MFKFIHTKTAKFLFYGFLAFIMFKACTSETPKTFYGNVQYDMLPLAENSIKRMVKYPETYERKEFVATKETDSTGFYHVTFTSKNAFGVPVENKAQVEFSFDMEQYTGKVTKTFIIQ